MNEEKKECAIKIAEECLKYYKLHKKLLLSDDYQQILLTNQHLNSSRTKIRVLLKAYDTLS